ncbi:carboxylating nicotinate-nucleotide diphosphorylase [Bacillus sp. FJAT-42376]|uniref:carboxylating nicotinate-nucleotide diphosphorylase n=1 Tax=Bacillus sp. FJAT-42376 TaxID=2014076 RepID=UPI000F501454|nr:carboxylating nicotinate-nucleotide diphosphorylase [Bacillus sp. FJAT-42376]AZB43776.1 carboxylating nicotinate-nucleotide diphosphorylase [Bacillus sp. FJAT-42376]
MNPLKVKESIKQFLIEDLGDRDLSASGIFREEDRGEAVIYAKEKGIFSGESVLRAVFSLLDRETEIEVLKKDGEAVQIGEPAAVVKGKIISILSAERVALNLLQRMSGIATMTHHAVTRLDSGHTRICDTRKTAPGLRMFDKHAVRCGGGRSHRSGLYDAVMIKDNHISFAGSISEAVEKARKAVGHTVKIEVEIEDEKQLLEAIEARADIIMFDNRTPEEVKTFIEITPDFIITEASGGINAGNLHLYRDTGVDYISLGYLTHSVKALDYSLLMK